VKTLPYSQNTQRINRTIKYGKMPILGTDSFDYGTDRYGDPRPIAMQRQQYIYILYKNIKNKQRRIFIFFTVLSVNVCGNLHEENFLSSLLHKKKYSNPLCAF